MLPPVETTVYVKWTGEGDELPGWHKFNITWMDLARLCIVMMMIVKCLKL